MKVLHIIAVYLIGIAYRVYIDRGGRAVVAGIRGETAAQHMEVPQHMYIDNIILICCQSQQDAK
jgi:hypothetical protein